MRLIDADALIQDAEIDLTWKMLGHINRAETVDAVPVKRGQWIDDGHWDTWPKLSSPKCSICHAHSVAIKYDFCPHCGARMDGE